MARYPKESNLFLVMTGILLILQVVLMSSVPRPLNDIQNTYRRSDTRSNLDTYRYDRYLSFQEMEDRLQTLRAAYPNKLSVKTVGQSVEGRNIYLVTLTDNTKRAEPTKDDQQPDQPPNPNTVYRNHRRMPYNNVLPKEDDSSNENMNATYRANRPLLVAKQPKIAGVGKPVIFVDGGIHAREWVAPAAAFYLIDQLLVTPSLTSDLEWRIMPMVNPDGYVFSQSSESNRFWRKNRARTPDPNCMGVDLNRNFDVHWEETHHDPCSEVYSGSSVFSEPESRAIRDQVLEIQNRLQAYITIHTYGQLFLYPFGYTQKKTPIEVTKLKDMGDGMAKEISDKYRNEYKVGQASMIGAAAGGSDDWAFIHANAPYSYTFELQSKVSDSLHFKADGFNLHPSKLKQAVDECWLALNYLGTKILKDLNQITRVDEKKPSSKPTVVETPSTPSPDIDSDEDERFTPNAQGKVPHKPADINVRQPDKVWTDLLRNVNEVRKKADAIRSSQGTKDCIRVNAMYVCPHMIFWNTMHP